MSAVISELFALVSSWATQEVFCPEIVPQHEGKVRRGETAEKALVLILDPDTMVGLILISRGDLEPGQTGWVDVYRSPGWGDAAYLVCIQDVWYYREYWAPQGESYCPKVVLTQDVFRELLRKVKKV